MSIEQFLKEQGVMLSFTIEGASLNLEEQATERVPRSMALRLRIEGHDDVRLSDKRSLKKVKWNMYLVEATTFNENATKQGAMGFLSRFDESNTDDNFQPESCHINAELKPDKFLSLVQAMQSGRPPKSAFVTLRGMKYGWEPDGSGKEWDEKQTPNPPVTQISFHLPLFGPRSESAEENEEPSHVPASAADIQSLKATITEQSATLRSTLWQVFWAAAATALGLWLAK